MQPRHNRGFTLIEALAALAIVSIALLASLRAAGGSTASLEALRSRMLGGWVAENVLAGQRANRIWLPLGVERGKERQGGIEFTWREDIVATPNPSFRRVDVYVFAAPEASHSVAHLVGFLVNFQAAEK